MSAPVLEAQESQAVQETKPSIVTFVEDATDNTFTSAIISDAQSDEPILSVEQAADKPLAEEHDMKEIELNTPQTPCAHETETRSEGGLDITPMLKALGARDDIPSAIGTVNEASDETFMPHKATVSLDQATMCTYIQKNAPEEESLVKEEAATKTDIGPKSRVVVIEPLPSDVDYDLLASLIRGGQVEAMKIDQAKSNAHISFVEGDDASNFVLKHDSGLTLRYHGREFKASARLSAESKVLDAIVEAYIRCGATRVIEVEHIDEDQSINALYKLAQGLFGREVESITDTYKLNDRITTFRFANLRDAVEFRDMLIHKKQWKSHTVRFASDPCEEKS